MRPINADSLKEKIDDIWSGRPISFLGAKILTMIDEEPTIDANKPKEDYNRGYCDAVQGIADEMVKQGKCIVQDRPQGEWIERYGSSMGIYQCSECGNLIHSPYEDIRNKFHAWCGRCGADMRGDSNE